MHSFNEHTSCVGAFIACATAVTAGTLIRRASRRDKEFHFQDWVDKRLTEAGLNHDLSGRNAYPDFTLVDYPEGYEVKGLGWPGREANYDSNSRVPSGSANGRTVFFVFGRYPASTDEDEYPVIDLVICHGNFLNADHTYVHKNRSFRGFGSYGDILMRDRKMYVAPTPFALTDGTMGQRTLIVPEGLNHGDNLELVGQLTRVEADKLVTGYSFQFDGNVLSPQFAPNPDAGKAHVFSAFRVPGAGYGEVTMRARSEMEKVMHELETGSEEGEGP